MYHRPQAFKFGLVLISVLIVIAHIAARAGEYDSAEKLANARRAILDSYFRSGPEAEKAAMDERKNCSLGQEPGLVADMRALGWSPAPDAADTCVAVLTRLSRDGKFDLPYRDLVAAIGGNDAIAPTLPEAIGSAAMNGKQVVDIGNGKGATITSPMAFDAGFTVAYQTNAQVPGTELARDRLKTLTEACLAERQTLSICYSIGFAQGARAVKQ